jgi:AAA domain-containing protein
MMLAPPAPYMAPAQEHEKKPIAIGMPVRHPALGNCTVADLDIDDDRVMVQVTSTPDVEPFRAFLTQLQPLKDDGSLSPWEVLVWPGTIDIESGLRVGMTVYSKELGQLGTIFDGNTGRVSVEWEDGTKSGPFICDLDWEGKAGGVTDTGDADDSFGLPIYTLDQLRQLPKAPWLVHKLFRQQSTVIVHGKTEAYKTFLLLDLFASIVVGRQWLGTDVIRQGPVLYVAAEGPETIAERLDAWCIEHDAEIPSDQFLVMTEPARLSEPEHMDKLLHWVEVYRPIAVAIDTFSKSMGGNTDENSNSDITLVLGGADRIKAQGVTVFMVHHPGHGNQERARGASSLTAGVDTSVNIVRGAELHATATWDKQKRGKKPDPIHFVLAEHEFEGDDGDVETTLAVVGAVSIYEAGPAIAGERELVLGIKRSAVLEHLASDGEASEAVLAGLDGVGITNGTKKKAFFADMCDDGLIELAGTQGRARLWKCVVAAPEGPA